MLFETEQSSSVSLYKPSVTNDFQPAANPIQFQEETPTTSSVSPIGTSDDHAYPAPSSSDIKRKLDKALDALERTTKKLKAKQQEVRRLNQKLKDLGSIVNEIEKNNLISSDLAEVLNSKLNDIPKEIFKRLLNDTTNQQYPKELKEFALTLHFYSPKGYNYVRDTFDLKLPCDRTIRSWYEGVDGDPGFTQDSFNSLKYHAEKAKESNKKLQCALMVDEMAIKKHVQYAGGDYRGLVDLGDGDDSNENLAKDVFVIMAVDINGDWKLPLAYFLIDTLTAQVRANILLECLRRLNEIGVTVVSLTSDGPPTNLSMFKILGANLDPFNMDASFPHPCEGCPRVQVVLDACHMLKLLRNALAHYKYFENSDGEQISWKFIQALHNLQDKCEFRIGNKLRKAHIEWWKQKMKVDLAAQVFSLSVADALEFCKDILGEPEFQGAEATIKFIRTINNLFDALNSRSKVTEGSKAPINKDNFNDLTHFFNETKEMLLDLVAPDGKPLYQSPRKIPIIGFLTAMQSSLKIFEIHELDHLLTYKLSQDHLELWFGAVRSRGGTSNNPTALYFKGIYKRLLIRHQIKNKVGNCSTQDNTEVLPVIPEKQYEPQIDESTNDFTIHDHAYTPIPSPNPSEVQKAVINYIAGFVVRKILSTNTCEICSSALQSDTAHELINMKNRGGLKKPSNAVVDVCILTDDILNKHIQESMTPTKISITEKVTFEVLEFAKTSNIFQDLQETHSKEHTYGLITKIASFYCKVKATEIGKKVTERATGSKIRKQLSKLILFKHQ
jgi:hypothetical protein